MLAFTTVFDSETSYEEKVPYLVDPTGLEETVQKYFETGEVVGRVTVVPQAVEVDGENAVVTYTILFGERPTYGDQIGELVLGDEAWQVPRDVFCALMVSARAGCP